MEAETIYQQSIKSQETKKLVESSNSLAQHYDNFVVTSAAEFSGAGEHLRTIKAQLKTIEEKRLEITRPMDEAKKAVMGFFKPFTDRLSSAEARVKKAMTDWKRDEDARIREEQRKAAEKAKKEEDKLRAQAEAAREKGKNSRAEILEERADMIIPDPIVTSAPKVEGISTRTIWKFRIIDPEKIPRTYMTIDEKKIGGVVRALKDGTDIPGIEVYSESCISARS
jgi:hypothetical protein